MQTKCVIESVEDFLVDVHGSQECTIVILIMNVPEGVGAGLVNALKANSECG